MKFIDYTSFFSSESFALALFATHQFEPDFFEHRLLKSESLSKARRVAVFVDAMQWYRLLGKDVPARRLNRRYLVVPVHATGGAFHPKLNLLLSHGGGQVHCHTSNLTRSGCANNLELLNEIPFKFCADQDSASALLAKETLHFFKHTLQYVDDGIARIAKEWVEEAERCYPWPKQDFSSHDIKLIHSYNGPIWDQISEHIDPAQPKEFFIISPNHDRDAELHKQLSFQWPKAKVELLVQQGYTSLPVEHIRLMKNYSLSEIRCPKRRLNANLIAWKGRKLSGCIIGSSNFTATSMNGGNVEAMIFIPNSWEAVENLFDSSLLKRPITWERFNPGLKTHAAGETQDLPPINISSAILDNQGNIQLSYQHSLRRLSEDSKFMLRLPGEMHPRFSVSIPNSSGKMTISIPDATLADCHGVILASLRMKIGERWIESASNWVIQESKLTFEASERASDSQSPIEETGEGLLELLDDIGSRHGIAAVSEVLRTLNVKLLDTEAGDSSSPGFLVKIKDPFESDILPDWLIMEKKEAESFTDSILEFVLRHEKQKLKKQAERGNPNGIPNFLNILRALIRLLYVYYKRGFIPRLKVVGRLCEWCELATSGRDTEKDFFVGYLFSLSNNLDGDEELLQELSDEYGFCAEIVAMLLIAQKLRYFPGEIPSYGKPPKSQKDVLVKQAKIVKNSMVECGIEKPSKQQVKETLENYQMFSQNEIRSMLAAI